MIRRNIGLALGLIALPACGVADAQDFRSPRNAVVEARGARLVRVEAAAGVLRVEGRPGLQQVRISGTASASDERYLREIRLVAERVSEEVRIRVEMPEGIRRFRNVQRKLDLVIEVPEGLPLDLHDGSGPIEIRRVAGVRVEDGSGPLDVSEVRGDVRVEDGSGSISISGVGGSVWLRDGSGSMTVRDVAGDVTVDEDGSGTIDIGDVKGSVSVMDDGSGSIRVADVGGDFRVRNDGSGGISHSRVAGRVDIPSK